MTTNHPEKLDEALIRPGRVDHQVAFSNASQGQIKELFERMYANDLPRTKIVSSTTQATTTSSLLSVPKSALTKEEKPPPTPPATPVNSANSSVLDKTQGINLSPEDLSDISRRFAEMIPDDMFSPAEIQGFLLKRKTEPRKALREVEGWVNGMIEQKKKGTKLVTVQ
jgi:mitochondrial chaperone BCS1